jgi:NHS family xanthosine MFS transporter
MVVDHFTVDGVKDWQSIWLTFAGYAAVLGVLFPFLFRYRHDPAAMEGVAHPGGISGASRRRSPAPSA